ncbi:MAG: NUDIX hydrolase [Alphaproteobacteria bacterium]|nr:NUDIX hydrolase [Alphaproteobacteria bacterium]
MKINEQSFQPWRTIERREVLSVPGRLSVTVETVELPDGRIIDDYWQVTAQPYVVVFAETADGKVICQRQYRHGPRRVNLELVAGQIETGEEPLQAAQRELLEEAGHTSATWEALGAYVASASQGSGTAHYFRARAAVKVREPASGDLEHAELLLLTRDELVTELRQGAFATADNVTGVALGLLG